MRNPLIERYKENLEIELESLEYNLKSVSGIASALSTIEQETRERIMGKMTYNAEYVYGSDTVHSSYYESILYNRSAEDSILNLRDSIVTRLENIKRVE